MERNQPVFYEISKIGKFISHGADHTVYEYGNDQVIKFSLLFFLIGRKAHQKAKSDVALCNKYFGENFLPTTIVHSRERNHIAYIQPKISGRPIEISDLKRSEIKKQFTDIARGHEALVREHGAGLDLTGFGGFLSGRISNIFIEDGKLWIIDGTIWEVTGVLAPIFSAIRKVGALRQDALLKEYLEI